jgi:hypothetical protein
VKFEKEGVGNMDVWSVLGFIGLLWALRQALDLLLYLWNRNKSLEPYKYG